MMNAASANTIDLPAALNPDAFEALQDQCLGALERDEATAVDASKVERLTTPCAQLLAAFAVKQRARSLAPKFIKPSAAFAAAWADFGLMAQFPLE